MSENKLGGNSTIKDKTGENDSPVLTITEFQAIHFDKEVRLGSRIIQIKEVPKFSLLPKGNEAKAIRDEQVKKVGSQWKKGTRDIIRGLTDEEELYYLPKLIGISPNSDQWNEKVLAYWADFGIEIPPNDKGVELEVGFKKTLRSGIYGNVEPISLDGYIKYNFCCENSDVATTKAQLDNPSHKTWYAVDKAADVVTQEKKFTLMKNIDRMYQKLINSKDNVDRQKIDWILETIGGEDEVGINIMNYSDINKEMELEKTKNKNPDRFKELVEDSTLEVKALIRKAITAGEITQEGNSYFLGDKQIGATFKEAVGYISNAANQSDKLRLIERIKNSSV